MAEELGEVGTSLSSSGCAVKISQPSQISKWVFLKVNETGIFARNAVIIYLHMCKHVCIHTHTFKIRRVRKQLNQDDDLGHSSVRFIRQFKNNKKKIDFYLGNPTEMGLATGR